MENDLHKSFMDLAKQKCDVLSALVADFSPEKREKLLKLAFYHDYT